jgi:hypothetical protein
MLQEPLDEAGLKRLIREIVKTGTVTFTGHSREEMAADDLGEVDVLNVLRAGWLQFSEPSGTAWRYRMRTQRIWVVITLRSENELVVVTVWRKKP